VGRAPFLDDGPFAGEKRDCVLQRIPLVRQRHVPAGQLGTPLSSSQLHGFAAAGNLPGHEHLPAPVICIRSYNLDLVAFL
jgi:hypothetical protein